MNADSNNAHAWPKKREKKVHKSSVIKDSKVKGLLHQNHKGNIVEARQIGDDCRYVTTFFCCMSGNGFAL